MGGEGGMRHARGYEPPLQRFPEEGRRLRSGERLASATVRKSTPRAKHHISTWRSLNQAPEYEVYERAVGGRRSAGECTRV